MKTKNYSNHLTAYLRKLQADISYLEKCILPQFESFEIDCKNIGDDFAVWETGLLERGIDKECSVLYYVALNNPYDAEKILSAATKAKKKAKKIALPKINSNRKSGVLYAGKTNSNFPSRLKYHLGLVESKTYALHLKYWAKDFKLTLYYAKLCFPKEEIRYLEMMENVLHESLMPLLGRAGH